MLTAGFSVQGASLKLLRSGEQGIITRINTLQESTAQTLKKTGLMLGQTVTLEQRSPRFIVRIGSACHALDDLAINAIYVRIVER